MARIGFIGLGNMGAPMAANAGSRPVIEASRQTNATHELTQKRWVR